MQFYVGLHQPSDARHFERCMISIGRLIERNADGTIQRRPDGTLRARLAPIECEHVMVDPQAFQILKLFGRYPDPVATYAELLRHVCTLCGVDSATAEDYMCEPFMLARTGLTVEAHQRLTVERYDELLTHEPPCYIMPVLQGYQPHEYVAHIRAYGARLAHGAWVGVGSVCKRNANWRTIRDVLYTIKRERPDLRLHGFGCKATAVSSPVVRALLHTADSMAWSFAARKARNAGDLSRDANSWREAETFSRRIGGAHYGDLPMFEGLTH